MTAVQGEWLVAGAIDGVVHKLTEPLSFWGGFDAADGRVIDRAHPQHGDVLTGRVVAIPGSRGSSGTPGVLGDALRQRTGPAAMIVTKPDINLVAGALAARCLYEVNCPILLVDQSTFDALINGEVVRAAPNDLASPLGREEL